MVYKNSVLTQHLLYVMIRIFRFILSIETFFIGPCIKNKKFFLKDISLLVD